MAVLQEFDPAAAQALSKLKSSSSAELQALLQLEELPLDMTAAEFTSRAVQRILVEAVQWQSEAFAQVCVMSDACCECERSRPGMIVSQLCC